MIKSCNGIAKVRVSPISSRPWLLRLLPNVILQVKDIHSLPPDNCSPISFEYRCLLRHLYFRAIVARTRQQNPILWYSKPVMGF